MHLMFLVRLFLSRGKSRRGYGGLDTPPNSKNLICRANQFNFAQQIRVTGISLVRK